MNRKSNTGALAAKSAQQAVSAGAQRYLTAYVMSPNVATPVTLSLVFYKNDGTTVVHTATSTPVTTSTVWQRLQVGFATPKGATKGEARVQTTGTIAKDLDIYVDCILLEDALTPRPWFDGTSADPDNGSYSSLEWLGTPDASQSRIVVNSTAGYVGNEYVGVVDGSLSLDGRRNIYRQANLTLTAQRPDYTFALERISPLTRLRLEQAVVHPDGTEEWVQLGILQVIDAKTSLSGSAVDVSAYDAGCLIDSDRLILPYAPYDIDGNALTVVEAIQDLVNTAVWEQVTLVLVGDIDTAVMPAAGTAFTDSKWEAINSLSRGIGCVVYVNSFGDWILLKTDSTYDVVAAEISAGPGGILIDAEENKTRREMYNAVPLRWDDANTGGLVFMVDADPESPTYWDGPYGHNPAPEVSNATVVTEQQAIDAAAALLAEYMGRGVDLDFQSVHNPLLEPWDVVLITTSDEEDDTGRYVLDSITLPLAGGTMSGVARKVRNS